MTYSENQLKRLLHVEQVKLNGRVNNMVIPLLKDALSAVEEKPFANHVAVRRINSAMKVLHDMTTAK